jgi:hypothetical protein
MRRGALERAGTGRGDEPAAELVRVGDANVVADRVGEWVTAKEPAHEALIGDDHFTRVQGLLSSRIRRRTVHKPHRTRPPYIFKSLIYCAIRERRIQGQHAHGDD